MAITSFRDLDSWVVSMDATMHIYDALERLPSTERFELARQMRRAAVSIPSNVAEGHACGMPTRHRYHVRIALGSVAELSTQLEICARRGYLEAATVSKLQTELDRVGQLLHGRLRSIRQQLGDRGIG